MFTLTPVCVYAASQADLEYFEREVRPVLAERCFKCHGAEKQKGDLRLDHLSTILEGGEQGPAIIAGNVDDSFLIEAIEWTDPNFQMPPKKKLSEAEITTLTQWVKMGAPWPEEPVPVAGNSSNASFDLAGRKKAHWAWQPIQHPAVPEVADAAWRANPIDAFVLDKLNESTLTPSPRADKQTLIRRLYFDLLGLPPAAQAVEDFVGDTSADAYERLVDGLLANPAYGERWGRHWMDLTRFAETYGHEGDFPIRHAWKYRDYVIRALNNDLPYNEFVREQIAGDLLGTPRMHPSEGYNESIIGTGWWYMHQATHGPVDVFQDEADRIDNQIDVIGKTFLGMHISCARCHDHKFDAISTKDYYAISGYARSTRQQFAFLDRFGQIEATANTLSKEHVDSLKKILKATPKLSRSAKDIGAYLTALEDIVGTDFSFATPDKKPLKIPAETIDKVAKRHGLDRAMLGRWVKALIHKSVLDHQHPFYPWALLVQGKSLKQNDAPLPETTVYETFDAADFGGWYVTGEAFGDGPTTGNDWSPVSVATTLIPPGVAHSGRTAGKLRGVLRSPTFTLEHDAVQYRVAGKGGRIRLVINSYQLGLVEELLFEDMLSDINTGGAYEWTTQTSSLSRHKGKQAYIEIRDEGDGWISVDEIRFANQRVTHNETLDALHRYSPILEDYGDLVTAYREWATEGAKQFKRTKSDTATVGFLNFLMVEGLLDRRAFDRAFNPVRQALLDTADELPEPMMVLATTEGSPETPQVFIRGKHTLRGDAVPTRFLEALGGEAPASDAQEQGRLQLAEQIVRADNPLTSRVMVNRIWHHLFGRGLVESVDNFGVLGRRPSHPELLDYLAARFQKNGWSIKDTIRHIVTSQTYTMSSALDLDRGRVAQIDPDNVLLHRQNIRRLEGEIIRDTVLAVAGQLDTKMYGDSIAAHLYPQMTNHRRPETSGPMDGDRRRSIYLRVQRNFLSPMILAFDMPLPDTTAGKRTVSNVPAQSLILMNDPFVVDQARAWAKALIERYPASMETRIEGAYLEAFGRKPTPIERGALIEFVAQQAQAYAVSEADSLLNEALWKDVCQVLFMSKEFIYIG